MGNDLNRKLAREQTPKIFFRKFGPHPRRKTTRQSGLDCTEGGECDIVNTKLVSVAWTASGAEGKRGRQSGLL